MLDFHKYIFELFKIAIKIVTDSTSDIPADIAKKLNIMVVPLNIHFGEDVYKDALNSFKYLNSKGHIIFDDFFWFFFDKVEENPLGGIFRFLIENKKKLKIKYVGTQLIIQKK